MSIYITKDGKKESKRICYRYTLISKQIEKEGEILWKI